MNATVLFIPIFSSIHNLRNGKANQACIVQDDLSRYSCCRFISTMSRCGSKWGQFSDATQSNISQPNCIEWNPWCCNKNSERNSETSAFWPAGGKRRVTNKGVLKWRLQLEQYIKVARFARYRNASNNVGSILEWIYISMAIMPSPLSAKCNL